MTPDELRAFRKHYRLSQGQLGASLGVHRMTVARWESGKGEIPRAIEWALAALAATLTGRWPPP